MFDSLKEEYGRDIFGQGYLFKIVEEAEIADVDTLTEDEKENGIASDKPFYVPYDKGDKDGNRWYLDTPFVIAWSKENVQFLKTNSGKKGEGMPVVRNPQFYFREGFCWSDIKTTYIKCRRKGKSVNDVKSMSLYSLSPQVPEFYLIFLINSSFISRFVEDFINHTQTFQINDARQIPVIIPTAEELLQIKEVVMQAISIKRMVNPTHLSEKRLEEIQRQVDQYILQLYRIELSN